MEKALLYEKINALPAQLQKEVSDFVDFLLEKKVKKTAQKKKPQFGIAKGEIYMAPDFDEPLEDFKDYM